MKVTKTAQKVAADILTQFAFAHDIDEVIEIYNRVCKQYDLYSDPFTGVPYTPEEYYESKLEYERQTMIERYGHCDGMD